MGVQDLKELSNCSIIFDSQPVLVLQCLGVIWLYMNECFCRFIQGYRHCLGFCSQ